MEAVTNKNLQAIVCFLLSIICLLLPGRSWQAAVRSVKKYKQVFQNTFPPFKFGCTLYAVVWQKTATYPLTVTAENRLPSAN